MTCFDIFCGISVAQTDHSPKLICCQNLFIDLILF